MEARFRCDDDVKKFLKNLLGVFLGEMGEANDVQYGCISAARSLLVLVLGYRDPYDRILNLAGADIVMLYSPLYRYSVGTEIEVKSKRS